MAKKKKIKKPRDWTVVHLINRGGKGVHNKVKPRSKYKRDLIKKVRQGKIEEI